MSNRGQLVFAVVIIVVGVVLLIGSLFDIDVWALGWPTALILLGLGLLFRPKLVRGDAATRQKVLLGDIRRRGAWQVMEEELWMGVGEIRLDMTEAEIPDGETTIRIWSIDSPVRLTVPEGVGVAVSSTAFYTDARFFGRKRESILAPLRASSDGYATAEPRLRLEIMSFSGDIKIERA